MPAAVSEPRALSSRPGQRGEVAGRGLESLLVRFSDHAVLGVPAVSHSDDAVVLLTWIALSRVADGTVTQQGESYLDGGAPLPPYLVVPVTTLLTEGLLAVADADPAGCCPVIMTEAGRTRHEQLRRRGAGGVDIP